MNTPRVFLPSLVAVLTLLAAATPAWGQDRFENITGIGPVRSQSKGDVVVKVRRAGDSADVELFIKGTHSGISGGSKFSAFVIASDQNGEVVWTSPTKTLTIGADALKGTASKDDTEHYTIPPDVYAKVRDVLVLFDKTGGDGNPFSGLTSTVPGGLNLFDLRVDVSTDWLNVTDPLNTAKEAIRDATPDSIANPFADISSPIRLGAVLDRLDPSELGKLVKAIRFDALSQFFDRLIPADLGRVLKKMEPQDLTAALSKLSREEVLDMLANKIPTGDLGDVIQQIEKAGWEQVIPVNIPWEWSRLDVTKFDWKKIDITQLPFERADPSQIRWSEADPSGPILDATEKIKGSPFVENAVKGMNDLGSSISVPNIKEKLAQGEKAVRNRAADLETSVRTEVGRAVAEIKEQPWYQQLQDWLSSLTHIILFDFTTSAKFEYNYESGLYYLDAEILPGVTATEATIENGSLPDVDPLAAAFTMTSNSLLQYSHSTNYEAVKAEKAAREGPANIRFVSERFVNWVNLSKAFKEAVYIYFTGGKAADGVAVRTVKIAELEFDEICSWIDRRASDNLASDRLGPAVLESILTGKTDNLPGEITVEYVPIHHEDKLELKGVARDVADIVNAVKNQLGLKSLVPDAPKELSVRSVGPGYLLVWKGTDPVDIRTWVEPLAARSGVDEELKKRSRILRDTVRKIAGDSPAGQVLKEAIDKFEAIEKEVSSGNSSALASQKFINEVVSTMGLDQQTIVTRHETDPDSVTVNLTDTPVANYLLDRLEQLAIGNEGDASIDRLELDLSTQTIFVTVSIRHRHVWETSGVLGGLADAIGLEYSRRGNSESPDSSVQTATSTLEQSRAASNPSQEGFANPRATLRWHLLEKEGVEVVGQDKYPDSPPVIFVPGALTTGTEALDFSSRLSDRLGRPVLLVPNPTILEGDSATPGFPTDLAEYVYDTTWPTSIFRFLARADVATLAQTGSASQPPSTRLQLNQTTRRLASLLEEMPGNLDVVTHSSGAACLRNAVISLDLLGKDVGPRVRWLALGSTLLPTEFGFQPASYRSLWHPLDLGRDFIASGLDNDPSPSEPQLLPHGTLALNPYLAGLSSSLFACKPAVCETVFDAGDLNGDGIDEAICICRCGRQVTVVEAHQYLIDRFDAGVTLRESSPFGVARGRLFVRDINDDGYSDFVLVNPAVPCSGGVYEDGYVLVRLNNRRGGFDELISTRVFIRPNQAGWGDAESMLAVGNFSGQVEPIAGQPAICALRREARAVVMTEFVVSDARRRLGQTRTTAITIRSGTVAGINSGDMNGDGRDELIVSGCTCVVRKKLIFRHASWQPYGEVFSFNDPASAWSSVCQIECAPSQCIVIGNWNGDALDDIASVSVSQYRSARSPSRWATYQNLGPTAHCCRFGPSGCASCLPSPCCYTPGVESTFAPHVHGSGPGVRSAAAN